MRTQINQVLAQSMSLNLRTRIAMPEVSQLAQIFRRRSGFDEALPHRAKITKNLDRILSSKLHVLRVLRGRYLWLSAELSLARFAILDPPSSILGGCGVAALYFCGEYFNMLRSNVYALVRSVNLPGRPANAKFGHSSTCAS